MVYKISSFVLKTEMESTRKQKEEQMKKHDEEKLNDKYTRMEETNHKIHLQKVSNFRVLGANFKWKGFDLFPL